MTKFTIHVTVGGRRTSQTSRMQMAPLERRVALLVGPMKIKIEIPPNAGQRNVCLHYSSDNVFCRTRSTFQILS